MARILVDSNVLLDIMTQDKNWFHWSSEVLDFYSENNILGINAVIYGEVSIRFEKIEDLEKSLPAELIQRFSLPWEAAFLAGKCFALYRQRGGSKLHTLPDFFIGAHAAIAGMTLMTRDAARYRTYFPALKLIAPE